MTNNGFWEWEDASVEITPSYAYFNFNRKNVVSGIYKIVNKLNGRYYIGSSKHITRRWCYHVQDLDRGTHASRFLQRCWDKHGRANFDFIIVESNIPENDLISVEQKHLDAVTDKKQCYNSSYIAGKIEMNETTRKRISAALTGKVVSEETKEKLREISKKQFANGMPEETRKKLIGLHIGNKSTSSDKNIYKFKNINTGEVFEGTRSDLYLKYKLNRVKISSVILGKERTHRGWRLFDKADEPIHYTYDETLYTFKHRETGEIFKGKQREFYSKYNFLKASVSAIVTGKRKAIFGWTVTPQSLCPTESTAGHPTPL